MSHPSLGLRIARRLLLELRLVRLVRLSEKGRLTQYISYIEPHLRLKKIRRKWIPPLLVFVDPSGPPNVEVEKLLARDIFLLRDVWPRRFRRILYAMAYPEPGISRIMKKRHGEQWLNSWEKPPPRSVTGEMRRSADRLLARLGIQPESRIVLFAVRDAVYYDSLRATESGERRGGETNTNTYVRNPLMQTYLLACRELVKRGYAVLRMGTNVANLPDELLEFVVDYAQICRSDENDVLLASRCDFLLNGASGVWSLGALFNKPQVLTNAYNFFGWTGLSRRDLFIPQLLQVSDPGRLLTFAEMSKVGDYYSYKENLEKDGVRLCKNTPEEILAVTLEMAARGQSPAEADFWTANLRSRFDLLRGPERDFPSRGVIGSDFLKKYEMLL